MTSPQDTGGLRERAIRAAALVWARGDIEPESDYTLGLYRKEAEETADAILTLINEADSVGQDSWLTHKCSNDSSAGSDIAVSNDTPAPSQAGWRLVPIEPTEEMCVAARGEAREGDPATLKALLSGYASIYRAMLAAAPSPDTEHSVGEGA